MTRRAIVVVGLVRDPVRFSAFLTRLEAAPEAADVPLVFSTWHGELEKYPELVEQLHRLQATVYVQQQPDLILPGHIVHQIASLDLALHDLDDPVLVLKTRPDFCDPNDIAWLLQREPEALRTDPRLPTMFRHRIWTKGGFAAQPFYLNDITFAGTVADLREIPRMPFLLPFQYTNMGPEQLYWGSGFIARTPALDAYFRVNHGLVFSNPEKWARLRACLTESPIYARALACYALIVRDNFAMMNPFPEPPTMLDDLRKQTLEAILWDPITLPGVMPHLGAQTNAIRSQTVWDAMASGDFAASAFGDRVKSFLATYDRPGGVVMTVTDREALRAETTALVDAMHAGADPSAFKNLQWDGDHWRVAARPTSWKMAQMGTDLTSSLEQEINGLRRRVQELQTELARKSGLNA